MEIVIAMGLMLKIFGAMAILAALGILPVERIDYLALLGSVFTGTFATPVLLPWIPGRAFSLKGMITGLLWTVLVLFYGGVHDVLQLISYLLILPSLSAFFGMNFTGSSTYTSLSGVEREMKAALPLIIIALAAGILIRILLVEHYRKRRFVHDKVTFILRSAAGKSYYRSLFEYLHSCQPHSSYGQKDLSSAVPLILYLICAGLPLTALCTRNRGILPGSRPLRA
jgi:hypothetical protein